MSTPTPEQRERWRQDAIAREPDADGLSEQRLAHAVLALLDALDAAEERAASVQFALDGAREVARRDNEYLISRERAAVAKALREAADDFIDACDWSDGRNNYGDNEGYEHSARILRARADRLEADA